MKKLGLLTLACGSAAIAVRPVRDVNLRTARDLGLSAAQYEDLPDLPGSDFMKKGLDVSNDTVSEYVSNGGETSRLPVYKFTFAEQNTYTNPYTKAQYRVADQLSPTTNTESMEYIVQDISYSFKEVLTYEISRYNIHASFTTSNISASVSYNHEIGRASDTMSNKSHVFAGSKKWWKIFDLAAYPPALVGAVDPMLTGVLAKLPKEIKNDADRSKYQMLLTAWGTHYIINGNFGGKLIHNVYIDADWYSKQTSSYVSSQISLNFHFDAFAIDGGGFTNKSQINLDKDYTQHSSSYLFYEGGLPSLQTNQTLADWEPTIAQQPHFLNCSLAKISELAEDPAIQKTLSGYIDAYLAHGGKPPKATL